MSLESLILFVSLHALLIPLPTLLADHGGESSIVFTTLGRLDYAFDIFTIPTNQSPQLAAEVQITDGESVNFNGHFPSTSSILSLFPNRSLALSDTKPIHLIYVTERDGVSNIYYDSVPETSRRSARRRSAIEIPNRVQIPLLSSDLARSKISMKDRPSLVNDRLVYVSTHENSGRPRTSWTAVYSTELKIDGETRRLTPEGVADFSPSVSPSGNLTAVASYGPRGWDGEVEELSTDIYVFLTRDGTQRVKAVEHGGWPCWSDESTLYFHRRGEDQWWSIYRATLPSGDVPVSVDSVKVQRVTPPGLHAFTPATSAGNKNLIAVATRRPGSDFRHVELFDVAKRQFIEITRHVSPEAHHLNPFLSPDSSRIGYHKCRSEKTSKLFLQNLPSAVKDQVSLFRIDGSFPSVSPSGDRVAYVEFPGLYVSHLDGSNRRQVYSGNAFSTSWDPVRPGVVYAGAGPEFSPVSASVDVISISVDDPKNPVVKKLTNNGMNNAFPSPSPDGKRVVFRSGLTGSKNLYIMGSESGEEGGLERLTAGEWTDTMCNWSPDGDWIAFASDRHSPGGGSFELYLIHPDGTGLRKLLQSGPAGRTNHPWFSPDSKSLVFTTDYSALSAEPISNPHHYQPYGEIFTVNLDGSDLTRLTHNSYEDGTPVWAPRFIRPADSPWPVDRPLCQFEDLHWLNNIPQQYNVAPRCPAKL